MRPLQLQVAQTIPRRTRRARKGRNPRTGADVPVAQKVIPFFKTGKEMRARLNRELCHVRPQI